MSEIDETKCIYYIEVRQFEDGEEYYNQCADYKNPSCNCDDEYNCYYKQLQQLKQENEALKQSEQEGLEIVAKLEAENNKLKKYVDRAGVIGIIKVLKCLDEIEEIIKDSLDACHACNSSHSCMNCDKGEILRKIKEVKGNE